MFKEKIQSLIENKGEKNTNKKIENIVVFIVILIITVIAINTIWSGNQKKETDNENQFSTKQLATVQQNSTESESGEDIEQQLEAILSNIEGVGKVKVLITYSQSSEVIAMYNENSKTSLVEEKDSGRRNKNYNRNGHCKRYNL